MNQQKQPNIIVRQDQRQVFYTVSDEDSEYGQQYMMVCPKDMDQKTLIDTIMRQVLEDPSNCGKKTIRIMEAPIQQPPMVQNNTFLSEPERKEEPEEDERKRVFIDPEDPNAEEILREIGLTMAPDGTIQPIDNAPRLDNFLNGSQNNVPHIGDNGFFDETSNSDDSVGKEVENQLNNIQKETVPSNEPSHTGQPSTITITPDKKKVFYTVTGEDKVTKQFMMICPRSMDTQTIIETLVKQVSTTTSRKGKFTIGISNIEN